MVKKPKKPKKPKEKKVAWNDTKQSVLRELLMERVYVEKHPELAIKWGLTTTWMGIINAYVTDAIKQSVLNDLIDDKVAYLNILIADNSAENTDFQNTITQGLALKE